MIKLKKSAQKISPYYVNESEYIVKLDANEGSNYLLKDFFYFENTQPNLYPDSDAKKLRQLMSFYYGCKPENIMVGNGSSDLINLLINGFCEVEDKVLSFEPSFSMYQTYCDLCGAEYIKVQSEDDFTQSIDKLILEAKKQKPKVVILCNPNNPTGYITKTQEVKKLLDSIKDSLIIVDEAYMDFGDQSVINLINEYDNLVVMRTLSKAFGLAGLRVGAMIAHEETIQYIWKVKIPYNLNELSQLAAEKALENIESVKAYTSEIIKSREQLSAILLKLNFKVYPSHTNFLFVEAPVDRLYEKLKQKKVLIREFNYKNQSYNRITVGTDYENKILVEEIEKILQEEQWEQEK